MVEVTKDLAESIYEEKKHIYHLEKDTFNNKENQLFSKISEDYAKEIKDEVH